MRMTTLKGHHAQLLLKRRLHETWALCFKSHLFTHSREHNSRFGPDETSWCQIMLLIRMSNVFMIPNLTGCTHNENCQSVGHPNSLGRISCMTPLSVHFYKYSANMPRRSAFRAGSINTLRHYRRLGLSASHMGPRTAVEPHTVVCPHL